MPNQHSPSAAKPTLLYITPTDFNTARQKGVLRLILERDADGFFGKVFTIHPLARQSQVNDLNGVHRVIDLGPDILPPFLRRHRFFRRLLAPFHLWDVAGKLVDLVRKENISLIRASDPFLSGLLAGWISRRTGVPYCVSLHADYDLGFILDPKLGGLTVFGSRAPSKWLERYVFSRAPLVMPIRQHLSDVARRNGARAESIRIIPHGIDLERFKRPPAADIRRALNLPGDRKIISFVGRLSKDNYIDDILEMARKLGERRRDFLLVVAGGGYEEDRVKRTVREDAVLSDCVRMTGFLPREDAIDLRRAADVCVCLMGGLSLIESCAAAKPVISYDVEWHGELVRPGETGFLAREHDINALVDAANFLLDHPDDAARMGQTAGDLAAERHDIRNTTEILRRCYRELLVKGGTRPK
ncbi:glycosyltransferase family 4 protein [bacterium]|nr:glycosyltransferase family 4 protein [bacterium]